MSDGCDLGRGLLGLLGKGVDGFLAYWVFQSGFGVLNESKILKVGRFEDLGFLNGTGSLDFVGVLTL